MVTKGNFNQLRNTVLSFFVKAVDGGIPVRHSLIPVYIHVLPPETFLPSFTQSQYSFTITEDTSIGSTVDTLRILPNQSVRFSMVNGERPENNKEGVFIIEQETGAIKQIIKGRDVIAQSQSGTGKTATFSVSVLQCLDIQVRETQALILAPTRELAVQIQKVRQLGITCHPRCRSSPERCPQMWETPFSPCSATTEMATVWLALSEHVTSAETMRIFLCKFYYGY